MASPVTSSGPLTASQDTYDTALCVIPPKHLWPVVDNLRRVYDPAYKKWPPHINLVYPFVPVRDLRKASGSIISGLRRLGGPDQIDVQLDTASYFLTEKKTTFYIRDQELRPGWGLTDLRGIIFESLGMGSKGTPLQMTVGQAKVNSSLHEHTLQKARILPAVCWGLDKLYVLVRDKDKSRIDPSLSSQMKVWGEINLTSLTLSVMESPIGFYQNEAIGEIPDAISGPSLNRLPYTFSSTRNKWVLQQISPVTQETKLPPESLKVSNYNVQAECEYPPTRARYPLVLQNLIDGLAQADILILEEVTDDFLSYLCRDNRIRSNYPYVSNGPPDQADIGPLPNYDHIVVLSKWPFSWDMLLLPANPRSSLVIRFNDIGSTMGKLSYHSSYLPSISPPTLQKPPLRRKTES